MHIYKQGLAQPVLIEIMERIRNYIIIEEKYAIADLCPNPAADYLNRHWR